LSEKYTSGCHHTRWLGTCVRHYRGFRISPGRWTTRTRCNYYGGKNDSIFWDQTDGGPRRKGESDRIKKGWAAATEKFLNSPAGADWPVGAENLRRVGIMIEANGLTEQPSVKNLTRVCRF